MIIENILRNIIYTYFPKGICAYTEKNKYLKSSEYRLLTRLFDDYIEKSTYKTFISLLISKLQEYENVIEVNDYSLLDWQYRCLSFEVKIKIKSNIIIVFLNISIIMPYYCIISKDDYGNSILLPVENMNEDYINILNNISLIIEDITKFNLFPSNIANKIIPDLSFGEAELGTFTFYNAFFLDQ